MGKTFAVTGNVPVEHEIEAPDAREAVQRVRLIEDGIIIERVGTREVLGYDEGTARPILDGDDYTIDGDGIMLLVTEVNGRGEDDPFPKDEEDPLDASESPT